MSNSKNSAIRQNNIKAIGPQIPEGLSGLKGYFSPVSVYILILSFLVNRDTTTRVIKLIGTEIIAGWLMGNGAFAAGCP